MALFIGWAVHDLEAAVAFPATADRLAEATGIERLRMDARQSWTAVGLMGLLVGAASWRGVRSSGRSRLYRVVTAGLEAHVAIHLAASAMTRGYTAGVATAVPVMLPGAWVARRELRRLGAPLQREDYLAGIALLLPAAVFCQVLARSVPRRGREA